MNSRIHSRSFFCIIYIIWEQCTECKSNESRNCLEGWMNSIWNLYEIYGRRKSMTNSGPSQSYVCKSVNKINKMYRIQCCNIIFLSLHRITNKPFFHIFVCVTQAFGQCQHLYHIINKNAPDFLRSHVRSWLRHRFLQRYANDSRSFWFISPITKWRRKRRRKKPRSRAIEAKKRYAYSICAMSIMKMQS